MLLAGFGGLLLLMLVAGGDALLVLRKVRNSDAQVRDVYLRRSRALDGVRSGIYQSAIVMRDYLLASDRSIAEQEVAKLRSIRQRTDSALANCAAMLDPEETGGAMLLGVDGVCVISHGSSSARAILNAVRVAHEAVTGDLVGSLRDAVAVS